jgi:thioredoxin reductase/NAD-dependent dihydropyrimidine dehydrogenase PreA subunit
MLETLIYAVVIAFAIGVPVIYIRRERQKSNRAAGILKKSIERGLDQPVSLHPYIDPSKCMGSGACVEACPEKDVLGLIDGKGVLVNASRCVGHGMCEAACPVSAITLVFGTELRGVDIPHVNGTFETNVPGVYIAGELGGMGLIRNAVSQGKQAAQNIAKSIAAEARTEFLDLLIVGAGPAGIAAALQAKKDGLRFLVVDQEDLGGTILTYPRKKLVMTQPMELPLYGTVKEREIAKETLIDIFSEVFQKTGLIVRANEKVNEVTRLDDHFRVVTSVAEYEARCVLLAIGRRGSPRKLGAPGEKSEKVAYRLLEPEKFHQICALVVGGGDSAVEAAVALAEQPGNTVHLSYRGEGLFRIKDGNRERIDRAVKKGSVNLLFNSTVTRIEKSTVHLEQNGHEVTLPNDQIFVFIGGELPTEFLKKIGIEFSRKFGER